MINPAWLGIPGSVVGAYGLYQLFYQTTKKRVRQELQREQAVKFIAQLAENHLPHIYHALELICNKLDVELTEPPAITYHRGKDDSSY